MSEADVRCPFSKPPHAHSYSGKRPPPYLSWLPASCQSRRLKKLRLPLPFLHPFFHSCVAWWTSPLDVPRSLCFHRSRDKSAATAPIFPSIFVPGLNFPSFILCIHFKGKAYGQCSLRSCANGFPPPPL